MTIQSNRRQMRRYWRNHGGWGWRPWHWDSWGWAPRVTVVRENVHPRRQRNMLLWMLAMIVVLFLAVMIAVSTRK